MVLECKMVDMLIPPERRQLVNHNDAKVHLQDKFVLICPDTNVLKRMVALGKYHTANDTSNYLKKLEHCLSNIEQWLSQMEACEKLFNMTEVGWIIPQQVLREVHNHLDKFPDLENYKNNFVNAEKSPHPPLQKAICSMIEKIDELIGKVIKIRACIVSDFIVLKEEPKHVSEAWKLVYDNKRPNARKDQQMKDSVILCHLLDFHKIVGKPLFFWTFDSFNDIENRGLSSFPGNLLDNIVVARDIREALSNIEHKVKRISLKKLGS